MLRGDQSLEHRFLTLRERKGNSNLFLDTPKLFVRQDFSRRLEKQLQVSVFFHAIQEKEVWKLCRIPQKKLSQKAAAKQANKQTNRQTENFHWCWSSRTSALLWLVCCRMPHGPWGILSTDYVSKFRNWLLQGRCGPSILSRSHESVSAARGVVLVKI